MSALNPTGIPWATHSWSPTRGCLGCEVGSACWAMRTCWRMAHNPNPKVAAQFEGLVYKTCLPGLVSEANCSPMNEECEGDCVPHWTGTIRTYPEVFDAPKHATKPQVIFVCPHGDLAHADAETVRRVFEVMAETQRNQYLVLTKWPAQLLEKLAPKAYMLSGLAHSNVWFGVSVTDQRTYDERMDALCDPKTGWPGNRWVSIEPCMGPIDLGLTCDRCQGSGGLYEDSRVCSDCAGTGSIEDVQWVVAGSADSLAHGAAAFTPAVARDLRGQAEAAGVPYFLKQAPWCDWGTEEDPNLLYCPWERGGVMEAPRLDGRTRLSAPQAIEAILRERGKLE